MWFKRNEQERKTDIKFSYGNALIFTLFVKVFVRNMKPFHNMVSLGLFFSNTNLITKPFVKYVLMVTNNLAERTLRFNSNLSEKTLVQLLDATRD